MKKLNTILLIVLYLNASISFAWGKAGHQMVAQIAKTYLNTGIQDSVQKYLGKMTFEEASTWMDDVRSDHSYDYMKTWHYINVEKDKTYVKSNTESVVFELEKVITELNDKSKLNSEQKIIDIKMLFHLVGDLHQPLHVGYGEDKGGNSIDVDFMGKSTTLHHVWDSDIIESKKQIINEGVTELCKNLTKSDKAKYQKNNVVEWMNDSRSYLPQVYDFKKGEITGEYINKSIPVIEHELLVAGLRLASVLNEIFKK